MQREQTIIIIMQNGQTEQNDDAIFIVFALDADETLSS